MERPPALPTPQSPPSAPSSKSSPLSARELASDDLLQGTREVLIRHGTDVYRLRLTRNGKLILHK